MTIHHGYRAVKLFSHGIQPREVVIKGYYLVLPNGDRHWIDKTVNLVAFENLCRKHLTEETGWRYWVDYCHGRDVRGELMWSNLDLTDKFLD